MPIEITVTGPVLSTIEVTPQDSTASIEVSLTSMGVRGPSGNGVVVASVDLVDQEAAIVDAVLFTPSATGMYVLHQLFRKTRVATDSSTVGPLGFTWVEGDVNLALTDSGILSSQSNNSLTHQNGVYTYEIYAKAGEPVLYSVGYASVGETSMQYAVHIRVEHIQTEFGGVGGGSQAVVKQIEDPGFDSSTTVFVDFLPSEPDLTGTNVVMLGMSGKGSLFYKAGGSPSGSQFSLSGGTNRTVTFGYAPDPEDWANAVYIEV